MIRPVNENEDYDVDAVCELSADRTRCTQEQLKKALGVELEAYAKSRGMNSRPKEKRRCWRLDYADGAQFHMDVLPAVPDAQRQKAIFEHARVNVLWSHRGRDHLQGSPQLFADKRRLAAQQSEGIRGMV